MKVIILCNVLNEELAHKRLIFSHSLASFSKVFGMAKCIQQTTPNVEIWSLGRGRSRNNYIFFNSEKKNISKINFYYCGFIGFPLLSQFLSILFLIPKIIKEGLTNLFNLNSILIIYNRYIVYLPILIFAKIFNIICILDIEDEANYNYSNYSYSKKIWNYLIFKSFDLLCSKNVIVASNSIASMRNYTNYLAYYGICDSSSNVIRFSNKNIKFLFSGTLNSETGLFDFIKIIKILEDNNLIDNFDFYLTGRINNNDFNIISDFLISRNYIHWLGELSKSSYLELLNNCDVALSLKQINSKQAFGTFPSKILEYTSFGLCLISTDMSDLKDLFKNNVYFININDKNSILKIFSEIKNNTELALIKSNRSKLIALEIFSLNYCSLLFNNFLCQFAKKK